MRNTGPRIGDIGAGILGASIANHLSRRGAAVTVFDGVDIEEGTGATRASFAWINASAHNARDYVRLRQQSMLEWYRLDGELQGPLEVIWSGSLRWDLPEPELEAFVREHASWGYDIELVDQHTVRTLESELAEPPRRAAWARGEAAVDAVAVARALAVAAGDQGARLHLASKVDAVHVDDRSAVRLDVDGQSMAFERIVVAAGTASPALLAANGAPLRLRPAPGLLLRTRPVRRLIHRLLAIDGMYLRQDRSGRIWIAGEIDETDLDGTACRQLAVVGRLLGLDGGLELEAAIPGSRPMPPDGLPMIGPLGDPRLYLCIAHSGVTLAPLLGRLAASELVDGVAVDGLEPYRPQRLAETP